ncbi:ATP-binding protein [Rubritalea tangerina]|uniref:ATP-binding protein n=2 Tax=Rubritalea tangerina TaxID=430798 RepID=A0ABW4ZDY8_9BACT
MHTITLPATATERALPQLLPLLNAAEEACEITLDFKNVRFYYPHAIVILLARCRYWINHGKRVNLSNYTECPASTYLRRIDFFSMLGIPVEDGFHRHDANGRFVCLKHIQLRDNNVDSIAREVAECLASENWELQECLKYAIGEIITNVAQHSCGEGYLYAQRYQESSMVHFAVADTGIGLKASFEGTELEASLDTDLKALEKALEPEVSSALLRPPTGPYGQYVNRGIGLSMVNEIGRQTYGRMYVSTGNAYFLRIGDTSAHFEENDDLYHPGVLVDLHLNTDEIDNFEQIITEVRNVVTPSELDNWDELFE